MKTTEGKIGRVFVMRLEHGDVIPNCIESFAKEKGVLVGQVILVGGIGKGDVVTGPRRSDVMPPDPLVLPIDGAHEVVGVGVLASDESGNPILHIHGALGRSGKTVTGCLRPGVDTWLVVEAVLYEILGTDANRRKHKESGFVLLEIGQDKTKRTKST